MSDNAQVCAIMALVGLILVLRPNAAARSAQRTLNAAAPADPRHMRIGGILVTVIALAVIWLKW